MAGSLFDQLKKAGLVDEKKAQKAKKEKYQQTKQKKGKKGAVQQSDAAQLAQQAAQQKAERDRQLNQERQKAQEHKANIAAVRQLIESNRLNGYEGDVAYNFVDDQAVKTLNVNSKTHRELVAERLRIARFDGGYALIPQETAEKVAQRDAQVLIALSVTDESISKEDQAYYAQFEIPDDLVW